jgi:RNA-binding protein Nova
LPFNYFKSSILISEPISDDLWEQRTHARILVSDSEAGSIIGRGGSAITALQSTSGALVKVSRRGQLLPGTGRRVLLVSGLFHQVMDAAEIILQKILYQVRSYPARVSFRFGSV